MPTLPIHLGKLAEALDERPDAPRRTFLDTETGALVELVLVDGRLIAEETVADLMEASPNRFVPVEPLSSRHQHAIMVRFAEDRTPPLRVELLNAIGGNGAFSRFRRIVSDLPDTKADWHDFRRAALREAARTFVTDLGLTFEDATPAPPPPDAAKDRRRPALQLADLMLFGTPAGGVADGRARRTLVLADEPRARQAFETLARAVCDLQRLPWRDGMLDGKNSLVGEHLRLALVGRGVVLEVIAGSLDLSGYGLEPEPPQQ